jgi:hypothetical protein
MVKKYLKWWIAQFLIRRHWRLLKNKICINHHWQIIPFFFVKIAIFHFSQLAIIQGKITRRISIEFFIILHFTHTLVDYRAVVVRWMKVLLQCSLVKKRFGRLKWRGEENRSNLIKILITANCASSSSKKHLSLNNVTSYSFSCKNPTS